MSQSSPKPIKRTLVLSLVFAGALFSAGNAQAGVPSSVVPPPVFQQPLGASNHLPAQITPGNLLAPPAPPVQPASAAPDESVGAVPVPSSDARSVANPVQMTAAGKALNQHLVDMHMRPVTPGFVPEKPALAVARRPARRPLPSARPRSRPAVNETPTTPVSGLVLSNTQLNILRFPLKIKHVWFPANTPLVGQPVYFAGDHAVMLQFEPGMDQPVQIMAEMANGEVMNESARLQAGPGATVNMADLSPSFQGNGAGQGGSEPKAPDTTGMAAVRLLQSVVQGRIPNGFQSEPLPAATPFQEFIAQPVMVWFNPDMGLRIYVFQLQSKAARAITVSAPEFYRPGVESVLLTSDSVGAGSSPFLYIVEAVHGE